MVGRHDNPSIDGLASAFGGADIGIARLLDNGAPDPEFGRFGGGNVFRLPSPAAQFEEFPVRAYLHADGRVLIVGARADQRPGAPVVDRAELVLMRVSNVLPAPPEGPVFADGFESL